MTEDEAKTKWCPFVRFHVEGKAPSFTVAPNREQRGTRCIGSACMAWREHTGHVEATEQGSDGYAYKHTQKVVRVGFCGLAGAPQ